MFTRSITSAALLEVQAILSAKNPDPDLLRQLHSGLEQYEKAVRAKNWVDAVNHDLHFHGLFIRFLRNNRLEAFYQKTIGELRMGMVLVDRRHDDPGMLVPVHRKLYQLLTAKKLKECAAMLSRHLDDSETRLSRVLDGHLADRVSAPAEPKSKVRGIRKVSGSARVHD
jgi:DNA-binding GntR family transcriptional regulator